MIGAAAMEIRKDGFIDANVELPPLPSSPSPVFRCCPRSLAEDLETGAVNNQMDRGPSPDGRELDFKLLRTARKGAVIRRSEIKIHQTKQRANKPLGLAEW